MCTDLEPVGNARIDACYKLDTVIEDVDGLVGLQCRLSQTLAVNSGDGIKCAILPVTQGTLVARGPLYQLIHRTAL